jgi:hypothetical protein
LLFMVLLIRQVNFMYSINNVFCDDQQDSSD